MRRLGCAAGVLCSIVIGCAAPPVTEPAAERDERELAEVVDGIPVDVQFVDRRWEGRPG